MSEPTVEQAAVAKALVAEWLLVHIGNTGMTPNNVDVVLPRMIAHALAAREALGFDRGVEFCSRAAIDYAASGKDRADILVFLQALPDYSKEPR